MIANFFSKSKPVNIIYLLVLFLTYFLIHSYLRFNNASLGNFLLELSRLLLANVCILLLVNFIVSKNKLIHNNNYPLLIIVLLFGTFPEAMFNNNVVLSSLFLMLSFRKIYSLKSNLNTKGKIFDSALWIGVATIFFYWSILFLVLIYVAIISYKKTDFRNFLIPIIGFIAPVFIYFTYLFYFDKLPDFYNIFNFEYSFNFDIYRSQKVLIPLGFLGSILVWAILNVSPKFMLVNNVHKSSWILVLWLLFISIAVVVISPIKTNSEFLFVLFPSAIVIANFIQKINSKIVKNGILYLFVLISITISFL